MIAFLAQFKLIGYFAAAGIIGYIGYQIYTAFDERKSYKALSEKYAASIVAANELQEKERKELLASTQRESQTLIEKKAIEDEAKANRACIAAGACGVRTTIKYQACPGVPNTASSVAGVDELQESNRRNLEGWINNLQESIRLDALYITKLQDELRVRSHPGYCQPK